MATASLQTNATANGNGSASGDLTGPCTILVFGTLGGACLDVEITVDSGTTWVAVPALTISSKGLTKIDVDGTYRVRTPVRGASSTTNVSSVASY